MEWQPWLARWSEEWISSGEPDSLDAEVLRQRWLGFEAATESKVAATEQRLGLALPPSYRSFLLTTDGWRDAGSFVWRMRDTGDLGWVRDLEPHWEESWAELCDAGSDDAPGNPFGRGLLISRDADAGILFLDPGDVDADGEWAAYSVFAWAGDAPTRFPSFAALMEHLYAEFHRMRKPAGQTRDELDLMVERARLDALAGDVDAALSALTRADEFGRPRATLLRVQLLLLLGRSYEADQLLSQLLHPAFITEGFLTDPLFTEELMPYLFRQHEIREPWQSSRLEMALIGDPPEIRAAIDAHEARARHPEYRVTFGSAEFDVAVREALSGPGDPWEHIRAALPQWQPRTSDHLAPVVLLADPALAQSFTPERGRELLLTPRGDQSRTA